MTAAHDAIEWAGSRTRPCAAKRKRVHASQGETQMYVDRFIS